MSSSTTEIGTSEKITWWARYSIIIFLQGVVAILGAPLFPIAYFIRHKLGVEGKKNPLWILLNYTQDSDWGLSHYKENPPKKTFWNALKWYIRNPAWNFKLLFKPNWSDGEAEIFETVKDTISPSENRWVWANKDLGILGERLIYFQIKNKVYGRYSYAGTGFLIKEIQLGASGNRYKFRFKGSLLWLILAACVIYIILKTLL